MHNFNNKINVIAKDEEIIRNHIFSEEEEKKLNELKILLGDSKWGHKIDEVYKLWLNGYCPEDIGRRYNVKVRQMQSVLKELGLARTCKEAAILANPKKNWPEITAKITAKGRKTLLERNRIGSSNKEDYLREKINIELHLKFPDLEFIVGINNRTILKYKEIDIPIIAIKDNKIVRIAVEYNGWYWHKDREEKDDIKKKELENLGYKVFIVASKKGASPNQINKDIDDVINSIIEYIESVF